MHAVTVVPGTAGSAKRDAVPEPDAELGSVLVEALAVGVCGTDAEIASGHYGWAPPGEQQLILGDLPQRHLIQRRVAATDDAQLHDGELRRIEPEDRGRVDSVGQPPPRPLEELHVNVRGDEIIVSRA